MTTSLLAIRDRLEKGDLLREFISLEGWHLTLSDTLGQREVTVLSYDLRDVTAGILSSCKGLNSKKICSENVVKDGLEIYASEVPCEVPVQLGIIVTDTKKVVAVLGTALYDYPQSKSKLIGFTGIKGKTTATYFIKYILGVVTQQKTASLSTTDSTLDDRILFKSASTAPEPLGLYRMMTTAVASGMARLIMEVSSRAYKTNCAYKLFFDVGIFLSTTPDRISPIEHPTFDDYLYCKRQLTTHSKAIVLSHKINYSPLSKEAAQRQKAPAIVYDSQPIPEIDYSLAVSSEDSSCFIVESPVGVLGLAGSYHLRSGGDFNGGNALSMATVSVLVGASKEECQQGIATTTAPGRMESLTDANGATVYADYARNYGSLESLLTFAREEHPGDRLIVPVGSMGGKAIPRCKDSGRVLFELADVAVLTTDDPASGNPARVYQEIQTHITREMPAYAVLNCDEAAAHILSLSTMADDAIVLVGRNAGLYQEVNGVDEPYAGDLVLAKALVNRKN